MLPANFNPTEHLQDTVRRLYNREVLEHFSDVTEDDLSIPRSSLRVACTHNDNDTLTATVLRCLLFEITARNAARLQSDYYGIPIENFESSVVYQPQIKLFFLESSLNPIGDKPLKGEITIRWHNQKPDTLTQTELIQMANRINSVFGTPIKVWRKGKIKYTYRDKINGYRLSLLCRNENDAKELIGDILSLQNDVPDWSYLTVNENSQPTDAYPSNPGTQIILGKPRPKPKVRPVVDVRFRFATVSIHGLAHPINLVDKTGLRKQPLVT